MSKPFQIKHGRKVLFAECIFDAVALAKKLVEGSTCCAVIQDHLGRVIDTFDPDPLPEHHEGGGPDEDRFATYDTLTEEA